ncbi:MAG: hypothetical protein IT442_12760 [Phycisphaeraceae bacterium]|nr:hypothetical protein [Phycisphaeraceae bacterium]
MKGGSGHGVCRSAGAALLLWLAVAMAGCHSASKSAVNPLAIDAREYSRLFEASVLELRDLGFVVDREDYRFGQITTRPLTSPTIFEFWKPVNSTMGQAAQSTANLQRRTVQVFLEPARPEGAQAPTAEGGELHAGPYQLRVEVMIERLQRPDAFVSGASDRPLGSLTAHPQEWERRGIADRYWLAVGRDERLERRLIERIVRQSFKLKRDGGTGE